MYYDEYLQKDTVQTVQAKILQMKLQNASSACNEFSLCMINYMQLNW